MNHRIYERDPRWREQNACIKFTQSMMQYATERLAQCDDRTKRIELINLIKSYISDIEDAEAKLANIESTIDAEYIDMRIKINADHVWEAEKFIEDTFRELFLNGKLG